MFVGFRLGEITADTAINSTVAWHPLSCISVTAMHKCFCHASFVKCDIQLHSGLIHKSRF